MALAGADVISPEPELPEMVKAFNAEAGAPFGLRFGVPSDFERVVGERGDRTVLSGELNPVFQGVYSNRIELMQWMREDERLLTTSEKLGALAEWLGVSPQQNERRWRAWEPVLFNQAHDLTSGTMVDKVYLDTIRGYQFSKELGEQMIQSSLDAIAARIDTRSSDSAAIPIVVSNSSGWPRTDVVETQVGFSQSTVAAVDLTGPSGEPEPWQIVDEQHYANGSLRQATVAFVARDVPAIGWSVYQVVPRPQESHRERARDESGQTDSAGAASTMHKDSGSIENQFYRATFDLWTEAMTDLALKASEGDWQALGSRPANIVAREQDGGDSWELYGNLNGGRLTAMT